MKKLSSIVFLSKRIPLFFSRTLCLFTFFLFSTTIYRLLNRPQTYMETPCPYMVVENEKKCKQTRVAESP